MNQAQRISQTFGILRNVCMSMHNGICVKGDLKSLEWLEEEEYF